MRQPTKDVRSLIRGWEKEVLVVYLDVRGIPTGGIGHTGRDLGPVGSPITREQSARWFDEDIAEAVETIDRFVPKPIIDSMPDESYDALVSFIFNVGAQAFRSPKAGKQTNFSLTINAGKWDEVDDRMREWIYAGGKKVSGLVSRRADESTRWSAGFVGYAPESAGSDAAEETGVVPEEPVKAKVGGRSIAGLATAAAGAVASGASDLVGAGGQLRALTEVPALGTIGAIIVAIGVGLVLWEKYRAHRASGA